MFRLFAGTIAASVSVALLTVSLAQFGYAQQTSPEAQARAERADAQRRREIPQIAAQARPEDAAVQQAQEQGADGGFQGGQGGRGGRGRGRGGRSAGDGSFNAAQLQRVEEQESAFPPRGGRGGPSTIDAPISTGPKVPIAINVWAITVNLPAHKASDQEAVKLSTEVNNLPIAIGSQSDVRAFLEKLKAAEMLQRAREFRMLSTTGENCALVLGVQVPMVTSTTVSGGGRGGRGAGGFGADGSPIATLGGTRLNQINYQSVGTNIQLMPQIEPNGQIQIKFSYAASEVEKDPEVVISESADGSDRLAADRTTAQTVTAMLRLKSGSAVIAHSEADSSWAGRAGRPTRLIIISATTLQPVE